MNGVSFRTLTRMLLRTRHHGIALVALAVAVALTTVPASPAAAADWPTFGQDRNNTASNTTNIKDVSSLQVKWTFTTGGDVSARAAVVAGVVYFPDWAGNLFAVKASNGSLKWSHQLSDYGLPVGTYARATPTVLGGTLYLGTQSPAPFSPAVAVGGAWLLSINTADGSLNWKTQLESPGNDPFAMITTSVTVHANLVYAGVASNEEGLAGFIPGFPCCFARGSVVAVNASTGAIVWKTYTTPPGYTGVGVWGSHPVVDPSRGSLYVGTGNNYSHPTDFVYNACIGGGGTPASCSSPDNHVDSILALDLQTGAIKWAKKFVTWNQTVPPYPYPVIDGSDDWNVGCLVPPFSNCPSNAGPDYDFASAPNLITLQGKSGPKTILGAGQKSGIYYALDPDNGNELWRTQVGPGSSLGGIEWGSASDGKQIYVGIVNFLGVPHSTSGVGSAGSWAALDADTGAIVWQRPVPHGSLALGPLAVAGGVVYAPSMDGTSSGAPTMFALSAANGSTLWSFPAGSSVVAGAAIVNDTVYWGSGYAHLGIPGFTPNSKFFAFSPNGQ